MLRVNESATRFKVIESSESPLNEVASPLPPSLLFFYFVQVSLSPFADFTLSG